MNVFVKSLVLVSVVALISVGIVISCPYADAMRKRDGDGTVVLQLK
jgi:hypothetical protein